MKDMVGKCESAKRQAYYLLLQHGAHLLELQADGGQATPLDDMLCACRPAQSVSPGPCPADAAVQQADESVRAALVRVRECVEDYLDMHKLHALTSALHEPARLYFHVCGNTNLRDHVHVHGVNGWLCILRGGLGAQLPIICMEEDDQPFKGCADVWAGLDESAWDAFSDPANFGKAWESIPAFMNTNTEGFVRTRAFGRSDRAQAFCGGSAKSLKQRAERGDPGLAIYIARFAHFFRKGFLVRRMFEVLNAETTAGTVGFQRACETLYPTYRVASTLPEGTLMEHLYDEYMIELDIDRAAAFFRWLGVLR